MTYTQGCQCLLSGLKRQSLKVEEWTPAGTYLRTPSLFKMIQASKMVRTLYNFTIHPFPDPSLNMVLLTGGLSGSEISNSTQLLNINGTVEGCSPPSLPEPRKNHVTFVTKDSSPKLATCGGSTSWTGFYSTSSSLHA